MIIRHVFLLLFVTTSIASCGYESDCFDGCNEDAQETPTPRPTASSAPTVAVTQCEVNAEIPSPSASPTMPTPTPSITSTPVPPTIIKVIILDFDIIYECKERSRHGRHRY